MSAQPNSITTKSDQYPLPPGWKRALARNFNNKPYFVNENTKETTWVDPRDKLWKKATWEECGSDEIPYGWEIDHDPIIGQYFIDHLNHRNLLDDPRSTTHKEHLLQVKEHIDGQLAELKRIKTRSVELQTTKLQVEQEEQKLVQQLSDDNEYSEEQKRLISAKIEEKRQRLAELKSELQSLETKESLDSRQVQDISQAISQLEADKFNQLDRQKQIQQEILELQQQLNEQSAIRDRLMSQVQQMQQTYEKSSVNNNNEGLSQILAQAKAAVSISGAPVITAPKPQLPEHLKQQKYTRIEREMELLLLRKQLQEEKADIDQLKRIAETAKSEVERAMTMSTAEQQNADAQKKKPLVPQWIKLLNEYGKKSATIRGQIKEKQTEAVNGGKVMSFRDKLLYFNTAPLEAITPSTKPLSISDLRQPSSSKLTRI